MLNKSSAMKWYREVQSKSIKITGSVKNPKRIMEFLINFGTNPTHVIMI